MKFLLHRYGDQLVKRGSVPSENSVKVDYYDQRRDALILAVAVCLHLFLHFCFSPSCFFYIHYLKVFLHFFFEISVLILFKINPIFRRSFNFYF